MKRSSLYTIVVMSSLVLAGTGVASAQNNTSGVLERDDGVYLRCAMCGTIDSITQNVGNQGSGGAATTIAGSVVGGLVAGRAVGNATSSNNQPASSTVRVNLDGSNFINVRVDDASELRVGDMVKVDSKGNVTRLR